LSNAVFAFIVLQYSVAYRKYRMEEMTEINGQPAAIIRVGGLAFSVLTIDLEAEQIRAIRVMANP